MLAGLLFIGTSLIRRATADDLVANHGTDQVFLFVASSASYPYSSELDIFANAARRSLINARFLYADIATDNLTLADLSMPCVPGVLHLPRGKWHRGRLAEENLIAFFNHCSEPGIAHLTTADELDHFLETCGLCVIAAFENATDQSLPVLADMHDNHFNEISIAYADPHLTGKSGFFVYRFWDNAMVEVADSLFGLPAAAVERVIGKYAMPDMLRADPASVDFVRARTDAIAFVVFDFHGGFYLSEAQIEFCRRLASECNIAICYEPIGMPSVSSSLFGFAEIGDSEELRIVEFADSNVRRYRMEAEFRIDNAVDFCRRVRAGQVPPYWRSAPIPTINDSIDHLVALNVLGYIQTGWSALAVYEGDDVYVEGIAVARSVLQGRCKIGVFELGVNEWPGQKIEFHDMPRLLLFRDGELELNVPLEYSGNQIAAQVLQFLGDREL
jgi:hypothetical protein